MVLVREDTELSTGGRHYEDAQTKHQVTEVECRGYQLLVAAKLEAAKKDPATTFREREHGPPVP